jgi:hypothetical protein
MLRQQAEGITTAEVDRALEAVLARPEYALPEPSLLHRWSGAATRWFVEDVWPALLELLPLPDATAPGWRILGGAVLFVGAAGGAAVLVYGIVRSVRWWRARAGSSRHPDGHHAASPLTAGDWEVRARDAASRGEWRAAAHALYQATLLRLGEAGVVRVDPSKTPGDYRREARTRESGLTSSLEAFTQRFERVAYGKDDPGPQGYGSLSEAAASLAAHG